MRTVNRMGKCIDGEFRDLGDELADCKLAGSGARLLADGLAELSTSVKTPVGGTVETGLVKIKVPGGLELIIVTTSGGFPITPVEPTTEGVKLPVAEK